VVTGFTGRVPGVPVNESIPRFKEVWTPIVEKAGALGVKVGFENCPMGGTWGSGDFNIAFNPSAWELMFEAIPLPNIGLEWEPCHQMTQLIEPIPQIRQWGKRFIHIHGKDATIRRDLLAKYGFMSPEKFVWHRTPGFGDSNWKDIFTELRMVGFKGSIDIEGWHDPVYRGDLEMTGQVYGLNYLKDCRGGKFVPNPA
jgi:sugar phosphate isomerase/epimerase